LFLILSTLFQLPVPPPWVRRGASPPPPARDDPATLWFLEGQTLETALAGREKDSIRALGGAVEARVYGGYPGQVLPNLEYADLRQSGWKEIKREWFYGLGKLSRVEFPPELETISEYAFSGDSALTEIWLPERLKTASEYAFLKCSGLREVAFPPSFETLSECAFSHCLSLRSVELPAAMKRIAPDSFVGCSALERLVVGDVEEWRVDEFRRNALGDYVRLKELRLVGRRWELVPAGLANSLAEDARVIGPHFVGRKLGKHVVVAE
jgi:hypothetical protein